MKVQAVTVEGVTRPGSSPEIDADWQQLRVKLREHFGETAFRRWFESVSGTVRAVDDGTLLSLALPTRFMRDWVEAHYGDTIRTLWGQIVAKGRIEFIVVSWQ